MNTKEEINYYINKPLYDVSDIKRVKEILHKIHKCSIATPALMQNPEYLRQALKDALENYDIIITKGKVICCEHEHHSWLSRNYGWILSLIGVVLTAFGILMRILGWC